MLAKAAPPPLSVTETENVRYAWNNYFNNGMLRVWKPSGPNDESGDTVTAFSQGAGWIHAAFSNPTFYGSKTLDIRWDATGLYARLDVVATQAGNVGTQWYPGGAHDAGDHLHVYNVGGGTTDIPIVYPGGEQSLYNGNPLAIGVDDEDVDERFGYRVSGPNITAGNGARSLSENPLTRLVYCGA